MYGTQNLTQQQHSTFQRLWVGGAVKFCFDILMAGHRLVPKVLMVRSWCCWLLTDNIILSAHQEVQCLVFATAHQYDTHGSDGGSTFYSASHALPESHYVVVSDVQKMRTWLTEAFIIWTKSQLTQKFVWSEETEPAGRSGIFRFCYLPRLMHLNTSHARTTSLDMWRVCLSLFNPKTYMQTVRRNGKDDVYHKVTYKLRVSLLHHTCAVAQCIVTI